LLVRYFVAATPEPHAKITVAATIFAISEEQMKTPGGLAAPGAVFDYGACS
jgi:hypothetical protein